MWLNLRRRIKDYGFFLFIKGDFEFIECIHSAQRERYFLYQCPGNSDHNLDAIRNEGRVLDHIRNAASRDTFDFQNFINRFCSNPMALPSRKGIIEISAPESMHMETSTFCPLASKIKTALERRISPDGDR